MEITRKGFIASVATALAATAAATPGQAFASLMNPMNPAGDTDSAGFSRHVGSAFELSGPGGERASVVLSDLVKRPSGARTEQFSLRFATQTRDALPEGTYRARHTSLGSMDLFLVPGREQGLLRADFNLLKS